MRRSYQTFCFVKHVEEPSRVSNQLANLVAHLLVIPILSVLRSVQSVGLSDHCCQILEVDTPVIQPSQYTLTVRSFRHCPWEEV